MTRILIGLWIFTASLLMSHGTLAGEKTVIVSGSYERIPVALARKVKNAQALETFYGEVINVSEIQGLNSRNIQQVLRRHQIELRDGEIFYPEEIEFLLTKPGSIQKAPHTPD